MSEIKYYYAKDGKQIGPYPFEEIGKLNLPSTTLIWHEGNTDWKPINSFQEFAALYENEKSTETPKQKGPSAKVMFFRLLAVICGFIGSVFLINVFTKFDVVDLIIALVFLALSVVIFKKNKVNYKMTDKDKGWLKGTMMGHMMNMGDD